MSSPSLTIKTPAKINIRLKVTGRRADGCHELVSILVPIDLFDILELKCIRDSRIDITSEGFPVPTDEENLVHRASRSFLAKAGIENGLSIRLEKNIPVAAGLGGGSSDAAATLLALNEIYSMPLSGGELHQLATELGADVPFFLHCRPALATGIGEILEPLKDWPELWVVVITPPIRVSTAWVYSQFRLELTEGEYDYIYGVLRSGRLTVSRILENDLEKVTSARFPQINTLKKLLKDVGADGAIMSGSGPSVFGLFPSRDKAGSAREALIMLEPGDIFLARSWERR